MVQQKTTRETETEKFITHRSWRKYTAYLDLHGRSRQGAGRERGRTWATFLYQGPWMECFEVPGLRSDWSIQTKKCWVLVSSKGSYLRGTQAEGLEAGEIVSHKGCWGSHIRNLLLPLWAVIQGMCLCERASVRLSPPGDLPNRMEAEAAIPWRSLAQLWTVTNSPDLFETEGFLGGTRF